MFAKRWPACPGLNVLMEKLVELTLIALTNESLFLFLFFSAHDVVSYKYKIAYILVRHDIVPVINEICADLSL